MLTKRQERALIRQNAKECAAIEREIERRNLWEYYTQKIIVLLDASILATNLGIKLIWASKASDLLAKRDAYETPDFIKARKPRLNLFQAIFWTLFGPDSHSLSRYFDHGHVPEWAKESKWTRKGTRKGK